jgi:SIR2-like domain
VTRQQGPAGAGHVFVVRGLLENLAADALIVPTDRAFQVEPSWAPVWGGGPAERLRPPDWGRGRAGQAAGHPNVWFLDVAMGGTADLGVGADVSGPVDWLTRGVREVLDHIGAAGLAAGSGRARPLVAMPTVGVEGGGYDAVRGEVLPALLEATRAAATDHGYDIALVAKEESDFAAFQAVRRRGGGGWLLPADVLGHARRLGSLAREGRLSLFLGAGVSIPAGLPSWERLLEDLLEDPACDVPAGCLRGFGPLDQAEYVRRRLGDRGLREGIQARFSDVDRHALGHALLAGLGCREIVTTNFDSLYELAFASVGVEQQLSVLPWEAPEPDRPWLLKMHGDVAHEESLTLTRTDFVRFDAYRRPLAGVLQTLLMSRHVLFVGASLNDDNVLRLVYETAEFLHRHGRGPEMGTVVTLRPDELRSSLYEGQFSFVATGGEDATDEDAARQVEILLDAVATYASSTSAYLLDPRYEALLDDEGERRAAAVAHDLAAALGELDVEKRDEGWARVEAALRRVGYPVRR